MRSVQQKFTELTHSLFGDVGPKILNDDDALAAMQRLEEILEDPELNALTFVSLLARAAERKPVVVPDRQAVKKKMAAYRRLAKRCQPVLKGLKGQFKIERNSPLINSKVSVRGPADRLPTLIAAISTCEKTLKADARAFGSSLRHSDFHKLAFDVDIILRFVEEKKTCARYPNKDVAKLLTVALGGGEQGEQFSAARVAQMRSRDKARLRARCAAKPRAVWKEPPDTSAQFTEEFMRVRNALIEESEKGWIALTPSKKAVPKTVPNSIRNQP